MPSPTPYATNNFGVRIKPLDYSHPHAPATKTYHGLAIVVNGNIVGRIQNWNPQMYTREGEHVYELNHLTYGRPIDYVPGRNTNYTCTFSHLEVWEQELERALGYPAMWVDLIDQDKPFTVNEFLFKGNSPYSVFVYSGCWFTGKNLNDFTVDGVPKIMANGEISFVSRTKAV